MFILILGTIFFIVLYLTNEYRLDMHPKLSRKSYQKLNPKGFFFIYEYHDNMLILERLWTKCNLIEYCSNTGSISDIFINRSLVQRGENRFDLNLLNFRRTSNPILYLFYSIKTKYLYNIRYTSVNVLIICIFISPVSY